MSGKGRRTSARDAALEILLRIEKHRSYSNLEINRILKKHALERREAALAAELVYGSLLRLNTLDWMIERFVRQGAGKLDDWVRQLLRLSFYQIKYLDRIPDRAAVHEAVELAKRRGHKGIAGFVNGVLRQCLRNPERTEIPAKWPAEKRMSLELSFPEWMLRGWVKAYGEKTAHEIAAALNESPRVNLRVNRLKADPETVIRRLREEHPDAEIEPSSLIPEGLRIKHAGNPAETAAYREGLFTIQDESSMLVSLALSPKPGQTILDACAAPGGKTTHLAERMGNEGRILAVDVHPHKKTLIEEHAKRLGIEIIDTLTADATALRRSVRDERFDAVLVDAPCSGFGVIRRRPEIKWQKDERDIGEIVRVQFDILREAASLVKEGGVLVYSTCTICEEENERLVQRFLSEHPAFEPDDALSELMPPPVRETYDLHGGMVQVLPHHFHSDGFFIARLKKKPV